MRATGLLSRNALISYSGGGWALEDSCITIDYVRLIGKLLYYVREKQN